MNSTKNPFLFIPLLSAASWFSAAPAMAVDANLFYTFFQDGYSEGATVTGSFSGTDLDGNGILVYFPIDGEVLPIEQLELTSWSMRFSGNSLSPAFDLALSDLYGFVYEIGSTGVGDDPAFDPTVNRDLIEGIGAIGEAHFYSSGLGPNSFIGGYVGGEIDFDDANDLEEHALDSSPNLVLVTRVPEPALGLLLAFGLPAGTLVRNRRR